MIEDKLTRDERIRLEALALATASTMGQRVPPVSIITRAAEFEDYVRNGLGNDTREGR